jgi:hypothetical protein
MPVKNVGFSPNISLRILVFITNKKIVHIHEKFVDYPDLRI